MKSLFNHNNKFNKELLNKGYFSSINKKMIYSVYMLIKNEFKKKLGRKCKVILLEQIVITLFKLRYNLPDRILEDLFVIDHVTISRIIIRISFYLSQLKVNISKKEELFYCVDSTNLRIGKGIGIGEGKNKETYSGYKHHHGVKFQVVINNENISILGDKGYSGLKYRLKEMR